MMSKIYTLITFFAIISYGSIAFGNTALENLKYFVETYEPTSVEVLPEPPKLPVPPKGIKNAIGFFKNNNYKYHEKYIVLLFLKLYRFHIENFHQSCDLRIFNQKEENLFLMELCRLWELNCDNGKFLPSSIVYKSVKSKNLYGYDEIDKEIRRINTAIGVYSDVLKEDSVVCWSVENLLIHMLADEATKEHMESHSCGKTTEDMQAKVISKSNIETAGVTHSIANIEIRYENINEQTDIVWTFSENLLQPDNGSINVYGQQAKKWMEQLNNPKCSSNQLKKHNKIAEYTKYDFSELLMPKHDFLGYIGDDFKRIRINFNSITKDISKNDLYHVVGTSLTGSNKCNFKGTIKIQQVKEFQNMHFGLDDEYKNEGFKAQGLLIGKYLFKENSKQKYSGKFNGIVTMYWYVDVNGNINIDDIRAHYSDSYKNNQYVGIWNGYNKETHKVCNWGEKRIPFSDDLDIGAAYFYPDPKYHKMGWEDFKGKE